MIQKASPLLSFLKTSKESPLTNMLLRGFCLLYLVFLAVSFADLCSIGVTLVLMPDHIFLLIVSVIVILERGGQLVISFSKYVILLLSYEGMRGIADNINPYVNYNIPIVFDRIIGGGEVPTEILQGQLALMAPHVDMLSAFIYILHFFVPFLFGVLLWWKRKEFYESYFLAFTISIYLALVTFLLVPIAPPWLAAEQGLIHAKHILVESDNAPLFAVLPSLYYLFNANPVAAFPSLHFAFPVLIAYFTIKAFGRMGILSLLYPLFMGFSLVYLAEHYVFDLLGGLIYTFLSISASAYIIKAYGESIFFSLYKLV